MNALDLLTNRRSEKKLLAPAPDKTQLQQIFQAAVRAPDHGKLQPYRFIVIEKDGRMKFAELLKSAVTELELGEERMKKAENVATRAPMIIAVVAKIDNTVKKIPAWEQMLCAGCAAYNIQLAANAQGFDNVWLTGPWVEGTALRRAFNCAENDKIIAFIMLGTAEEKAERDIKPADPAELISYL